MSNETQLYVAGLYLLTAFVIAVILYFIFRSEARKDQEQEEKLKNAIELK